MALVRVVAFATLAGLWAHSALAFPLNDTGQIVCYDDSTVSTGTVAPGNAAPESAGFEGQDCSLGASAADAVGVQGKIGSSSTPGRDYTKIGNDGSELSDSATLGSGDGDWGCTRDNVTGLVWAMRLDDGSFRDRDWRHSWNTSGNDEGDTCGGTLATCNSAAYVEAMNTTGFCGRSDWRLPATQELESLLSYADPEGSGNLIDRQLFPDQSSTLPDLNFWTAFPDPEDGTGTSIWVVDFSFGWVATYNATSSSNVRLVSGSLGLSGTRYTVSEPVAGEPVSVDNYTGLMWKSCPQGLSGSDCSTGAASSLTWSGALTAAASESWAGYDDWRLPNIMELGFQRNYFWFGSGAPIDATAFPGTGTGAYWSSTSDPRPGSENTALGLYFSSLGATTPRFKTDIAAVRLVRGGNFLAAHGPVSDTTPDAFTFAGKDASAGTLVESDPVTLGGLTGPASIKVSGAAQSAYSINSGSYSSGIGAVGNGDTVRVRHQAAASAGATAVTTLSIGATAVTFTSTAVATPPGPPTSVVATAGDTSVTLTFDAPANDGGSPITGYTASGTPSGGSSSCTSSAPLGCTITGLTNGQSYTFTVTAGNALGAGTASDPSNAVTPATTPSAPTGISASAGNGQATVTFTAPGDNGGSAILDYTITRSSTEGQASAVCAAPPCTVTGLSNGTLYTFTARARNAIGLGAASAASNQVKPGATPTIQFIGSPRLIFPANYNRGLIRLGAVVDQVLEVTDADNAADTLIVTVDSDNPDLLPASTDILTGGGFLVDRDGTRAAVSLRPQISASGSASVVYTVTDPDGRSASTSPITVTVPDSNLQPSAGYIRTIRLPANAAAGPYSVPSYVMASSVGAGEDFTQTLSHRIDDFLTPSASNAAIDAAGTLSFDFNGSSGGAETLIVWPVDDGAGDRAKCEVVGTDWAARVLNGMFSSWARYNCGGDCGGTEEEIAVGASEPCGEPYLSVVVVGSRAAIFVGLERVATSVARAKATSLTTVPLSYRISVHNAGGAYLQGVTIALKRPGKLLSTSWTCSSPQGACRPESGTGDVLTEVDLDLDDVAEITLEGSVDEGTNFLPMAVDVSLPDGVDGETFGSGVVDIDVLSNGFIYFGGFEGN